MAPRLYATITSPAVRAVLLTSKALGLNLELQEVDLNSKEHLKPSFIKMNPQHTVPTLVDDDEFIIWDSHAINGYLVDKYSGIDDTLYPTDPQLRAKVNQTLYFETELATLSHRIFHSILHGKKKSVPQDEIDEITEKLELLEKFLSLTPFAAGQKMTIADFSLLTTITAIDILIPIDAKKFPKITAWLKKAQALPYYGINKSGNDKLRNIIASALQN